MPCGRPTLPTGTKSESTFGELGEDLVARHVRTLSPFVRSAAVNEVERPVGARLLVVRQADAARVDDALAGDRPLELHVRVAADDDVRVEAFEEERDPVFGR